MKNSGTHKNLPEWRVTVFEDTLQIPRSEWQSCTQGAFYSSIDFLSALSQSKVENAEYRYLIFYKEDHPAGAAVLSRFYLNLDLLAGIPWLTKLKKAAPSFLRIPMICCGIPASFGQLNMHAINENDMESLTKNVHLGMMNWAKETHTALLVWKEWRAQHAAQLILSHHGYTHVDTLPDYQMHHLPIEMSDFLNSMRSNYRRKYMAVASFLNTKNGDWNYTTQPFKSEHAEEFYEGYKALMQRTPVKLEQYNLNFFRLLSQTTDFEIILHRIAENNQSVQALVAKHAKNHYLMLVSKPKNHYSNHLYVKLLQLIVLDAVNTGAKSLYLGQTSDYSKACLGAQPLPLQASILFTNNTKNNWFGKYAHWLFPKREVLEMHIFKISEPQPSE